ncbi:MAG TPA: ferrochelatase, partial [Candidatus Obscuribacterales bacterium]
TRLIFTAHSIPQEMSDKSGYAAQVEETAAAVSRLVGSSQVIGAAHRAADANDSFDWVIGWQSRSGPPQQKWLEPDVLMRLEEAKAAGKTHAVVVPVGFLVDHVEVLYDLDVLAAAGARLQGITMLRAATVGDHPKFVQMLAELAGEKIESFYARS